MGNRFAHSGTLEGTGGCGEALSALWGRPQGKVDGQKEAISVAEWSPLVDITEDEKEYLIKAELPEVKREDVKLTVQDNVPRHLR